MSSHHPSHGEAIVQLMLRAKQRHVAHAPVDVSLKRPNGSLVLVAHLRDLRMQIGKLLLKNAAWQV